jgi:hypothetical protein
VSITAGILAETGPFEKISRSQADFNFEAAIFEWRKRLLKKLALRNAMWQ